ncbi:MAG: SDR family NAD(P)-dependent oxidoreductase [Ferruginibacter sp.]
MRTAIVTGASGNMGQAVVKKFLKEGFLVIGTIVPNDPAPLEITDPNFQKEIVDLMAEESTAAFVDSVIEKNTTVDVLVATVGGFASGNIAKTSTADILMQYKLNFETAYNTARPVFIQMMTQKSGRIFLIGSKPGLDAKSADGMVAYSLGKSLIFRLAELMNIEAKGMDVVTAVLVPSTIDTPQNRTSMPGSNFDTWVKTESIADTIYFYCTKEAGSIREPIIKLYNNS